MPACVAKPLILPSRARYDSTNRSLNSVLNRRYDLAIEALRGRPLEGQTSRPRLSSPWGSFQSGAGIWVNLHGTSRKAPQPPQPAILPLEKRVPVRCLVAVHKAPRRWRLWQLFRLWRGVCHCPPSTPRQ